MLLLLLKVLFRACEIYDQVMKLYLRDVVMKISAILSLLAALTLIFAPETYAESAQFPIEDIRIETDSVSFQMSVEIARSQAQLAQGLMNRKHLGENRGMLFDFGLEKPIYMWMKNTLIPLDMVFLDSRGRIVGIREQTTPLSEAIITVKSKAKSVLEINGGAAAKLGLKIGDRVIHPMFD